MDNDKRLKLAKEALESGSYDRETIEYIFPELKESYDEKIKKAIIEHFAVLHSSMYPYKGFTKEQILAWIEKQGEQKPSWSKEDENRFNNLIKLVENSNECDATKQGFIAFLNKFKSFKPHWKPTQEQMIALKIVKKGFRSDDLDAIKSLYNDLKKL